MDLERIWQLFQAGGVVMYPLIFCSILVVAVTFITGDELKNKGARTLADALTGVSGVIVKRYGGGGEKAIP